MVDDCDKTNIKSTVVCSSPQIMKSPSDTTIYTPAIQRAMNGDNGNGSLVLGMLPPKNSAMANNGDNDNNMIQKISNFVESMQVSDRKTIEVAGQSTPMHQVNSDKVPGYEEARNKAQKALLDAEKYKATIAEPPEAGKDFE